MIQIQDMFKKGKPDIVLKTVNRFNIKTTPCKILLSENSLKLGIVVLVMLNKMLVIEFIFNFYTRYRARILETQSFYLRPFLPLSVRNGPSVSFGINVPCTYLNTKLLKKMLVCLS